MARKRWAVPCTARRTDGTPCKNWAITGARVCRPHGGALRTTRWAATRRVAMDDFMRAAEAEQASLRLREVIWLARRCNVAADAAGDVDAAELARRPALLVRVEAEHGITPPRRPELHRDRRFRARREGFSENLPRLPANSRRPARTPHMPGCSHWPKPAPGGWCPTDSHRRLFEITAALAEMSGGGR